MKSLPENYRIGEKFGKTYLDNYFSKTFNLTSGNTDFEGTDLESSDNCIGVYVRTRFEPYKDVTFNGEQALKKLVKNLNKYDKYYILLQHARGKSLDDPNFKVYYQGIIDLNTFTQDILEKDSKLSIDILKNNFKLRTKKETNKNFYVWETWKKYVVVEEYIG